MSMRPCSRLSRPFALSLLAAAAVSCTGLSLGTLHAQQTAYTSARRNAELHVELNLTAGPERLRGSVLQSGKAVSVAVTHFAGSGAPDLMTGYAVPGGGALVLQHGFAGATAPGEAEAAAMIAGRQVTPFVADGSVFALPVAPDLLETADLDLNGTRDVLAAAKGGTTLYLLKGDGTGSFSEPAALALRGKLHSLALWTGADALPVIAAGVCGDSGCGIQLLSPDGTTQGFVALPGKPTALSSGRVNNGALPDLLVIAGGRALVLDGDSVLSGRPKLKTLPVSHAVAIAPGSFVWDHRGLPQIAVLSEDATLTILARPGVNRNDLTREELLHNRLLSASHGATGTKQAKLAELGWAVAETTANIGPGHDTKAVMLRGQFTVAGADDLVVLSGGQYVEIAHPTETHDGVRTSTAAVTVDSTSSPVTAAVPARVTPDSRMGIVSVAGDLHPLVTAPTGAYRTYYVNSYTDALNTGANRCVNNLGLNASPLCSLRDALVLANADRSGTSAAGVPDKIFMPNASGTYALTTRNSSATYDAQGDLNYHLNIETNVNIIGQAGCTLNAQGVATSCPTVIDAKQQDIVFALNSSANDSNGADFAAYSVFMSGLQLQNGLNQNNPSGAASGLAAANNGGLIYTDLDGGTLLLNTMVLLNGRSNYAYGNGGGGAVSTLNSAVGSRLATLEIDNSTLSRSVAAAPAVDGGGVFVAGDTNFSMTNGIVSGNSTTNFGGGIATDFAGTDPLTAASTLTNVTVSGNTAGQGGGMNMENSVSMSQMTVTGNTMTGNSSQYASGGGGIYLQSGQATPDSLVASTITGNTLTSNTLGGAGISVFFTSGTTPLTMQYNRIHGNTGGVSSSTGLEESVPNSNSEVGAVAATNNWWGCNTDPQLVAPGCDTASRYGGGLSTLTTVPYTTLKLALSSSSPAAGSTLTATASLGQNSAGTVYSVSNDAAYLATPISAFSLSNAGSVTYNPSATAFSSTAAASTSSAAATASGTAVAGSNGTASVTVDNVTLSTPFTVSAIGTNTAVSVGASALALGGTTTVSATVTANSGTPTGSVNFYDAVNGTTTTTNVPLNGTTAAFTYNASTAGTHTITATFVPSGTTFAGSSDPTGKTITVSKAPAATGNIVDSTQVGKPLTVAVGSSVAVTINYPYPGTVAPTGALTVTVNGTSNGVSALSCVNKSKHANCSLTYTDSLSAGNYSINFSVAPDGNYNLISGSAPITVTSK